MTVYDLKTGNDPHLSPVKQGGLQLKCLGTSGEGHVAEFSSDGMRSLWVTNSMRPFSLSPPHSEGHSATCSVSP